VVNHSGVIYDAVASQPWSGEAVVRVSIVNWCKGNMPGGRRLWLTDGTVPRPVSDIHASLSVATDVQAALPLRVSISPTVCGEGQKPGHRGFVLSPDEARRLVTDDPASAAVIWLYATKRGSDLAISPFGVCQVTLQDPTSSQSTQTA
jgi:hypothetical protein